MGKTTRSPKTQQPSTCRIFLEYFSRGVARTFAYELVDAGPNQRRPEIRTSALLRNDLSEKPAFIALRDAIATLADPGPAFSPESLDYSLGGGQADLRELLLQKRDGSFYLALWRATAFGTQSPEPLNLPRRHR